ncbi:hypothetical protein Pmani_020832 [Petrolisthes manimaculis]|uniref:Thioredoxin domain-containing protein n=1 Tax=Petrolisthes manimaculis TaxID=1843537 RepID=A0AAE1PFZ5_9EUCA|nr:hypothetical protein Pmani_020832 [Petrolisthes manimaculis]
MRLLVRGSGRVVARSALLLTTGPPPPTPPTPTPPLLPLPYTTTRTIHHTPPARDVYNIANEDEFKNKVMRSELPVIVNFHADWCEPCHSLRPLLQKIAQQNTHKLHLAEVLVEEHIELLQAFEVTAVPAVLGIHRGMVVGKFVGLVSHKEVTGFVEKLLNDD